MPPGSSWQHPWDKTPWELAVSGRYVGLMQVLLEYGALTRCNMNQIGGIAAMRDTVLTMLPIPRDVVEHPSDVTRDELVRLVGGFGATCVKEGKLRKITLTISGYDNDPRELYEIPEVCAWARDIIKLLPSLPFFLDEDSQYRFVGWLCGPVSPKEIESRQFQKRFQETRTKCIIESTMASSQFLERAGASTELVSTFYSQEIRRHAAAQAQHKRWWQFWK